MTGQTVELLGENISEFLFQDLGLLFAVKASSEGQKIYMEVYAYLGNFPYSV